MDTTTIKKTDEGKKQIAANETGKAYNKGLSLLKQDMPHATTVVDDYLVSVGFEKAAGWYVVENGQLVWHQPEKEQNVHIEVIVQDRNDLRFIPYLDIYYKLFDEQGKQIGEERKIDFIWHPFVYHYAEDWTIPKKGKYTAEVLIKQPTFRRHDQVRGKRYEQPVKVTLGPIEITPGHMPVGPE